MSQTRSEVTDGVLLDGETGWPVDPDPEAGPDGVPFGRYRRCLDCRGSGVTQGETCSRCHGVPYVDGTEPHHWCTRCQGRPLFVDTNCAPGRVSCPGPPSFRDETNDELSDKVYDAQAELSGLVDQIAEDDEEPAHLLETHHKLYVLAAEFYTRAMDDPRLDPDTRAKYDGRNYVAYG